MKPPNRSRLPWKASIAVLCSYTLLTIGLGWNLLGNLDHALIGDGHDGTVFLWNVWWLKRSLLHGTNPYFCDMQFAPDGVPLYFHAMVLLPSTVAALLSKVIPLPAAYNLVLLGAFPLAGWCAFRLAFTVTGRVLPSAVGGLVFLLCPYMASKSLGHFNLLFAALLPLYTAYLIEAARDEDRRLPRFQAAGALLLIALSNMQTVIFAANVTVWLIVYELFREHQWRRTLGRLTRVLAPTVVVGGLWAAFLVYHAVTYRLWPQRGTDIAFSPELYSYIFPLHRLSWWHDSIPANWPMGETLGGIELAVYLGMAVLPLAVAGFVACRKDAAMRFMAAVFVVALVLSMGHKLIWQREVVTLAGVPVYLPMGIYRYVPILGGVVQHGRYMVIGYMALAAGVAGLIAAVQARWRRAGHAVAVVVALLIVADYGFGFIATPLPPCPIPPGDGAVCDPRLWRGPAVVYQTVHERPLVGGHVSRITDRWEKRYEEMEGLGWFFRKPRDRGVPPTCEAIRADCGDLDIRYICVDPNGAEQDRLSECGFELTDKNELTATFSVPPGISPDDSPQRH